MTQRIAELNQIVPVRMRSNDPISRPPASAPDPDVGSRWGRASAFQFSAANPPLDGEGSRSPMFVRRSRKYEYETRVTSVPRAEAFTIEDYTYKVVADFNQIPGSYTSFQATSNLPVLQYSSREESLQEISGFTSFPDGTAITRYRPAIYNYLLTLSFNLNPAPSFTGDREDVGQKP